MTTKQSLNIRYITNSEGKTTDVIIPVEIWKKMIISLDTKSGLAWIDEQESKEEILADLKESIQDAKAGKTFPIDELWDDIEV
jgi:hypothetical protein